MSSQPPAQTANAPYLSLLKVLRAAALLFSGPLIVLGFVVDFGPEVATLVLGLALMVWGRNWPERLDQIRWANVPVLGELSRPRMIAVGVGGGLAFAASAALASPFPPPSPSALAFSTMTPTIGQFIQARAALSGNVFYTVFADSACLVKRHSAGRARFSDLPIPPSDPIAIGASEPSYLQATYVGSYRETTVKSLCAPLGDGRGSPTDRLSSGGRLALAINAGPQSGFVQAVARFDRAVLSYDVYRDASCVNRVRNVGTKTFDLGSVGIATSDWVAIEGAGVSYWQARLLAADQLVSTTACAVVSVPKNRPIVINQPIQDASIGVAPAGGIKLDRATADAAGNTVFSLFSDAGCSSKVGDAGQLSVRDGALIPANTFRFNDAGSYFLHATYSGDSNNESAVSACVGVTVSRSRPLVLPGGSETALGRPAGGATLSGASANATGKVTYALFAEASCGTQIASGDVNVEQGVVPPLVARQAGSFGVRAAYTGDKNNDAATSPCWALTVRRASPSLSLTVPSGTSIGASTKAAATLSSAVTPTGSIRFILANDDSCGGLPQVDGGSGTATTSGAVESNPMTFANAGVAYWQALYAGDANNDAASSGCIGLTVAPNRPTLIAGVSPSVGTIGGAVTMSSNLSGGTGNIGGQITYRVFGDASCSSAVSSAGVRAVSNGQAGASDVLRFPGARTVWWQASYSGDGNNTSATSSCVTLVVEKARPMLTATISSDRYLDRATILGTLGGATSTATGTLTYLRSFSSTCASAGATSLGVVQVTAGRAPASPISFIVSVPTNYVQVIYSGDANNEAANSGCVAIPGRVR